VALMSAHNLFNQIFLPEREARIAVLFEQREISYDELRSLTISTGEKLNALEIQSGDRVAILLNDSPEFVAAFVAIISLGAIAVPINMALRKADQLTILKDSGATVAITEAQAAVELSIEFAEGGELKHLLIVDRGADSRSLALPAGLRAQPFDSAEKRSIAGNFPEQSVDNDAFILYTSGSTGEPKGAVHSQSDIFYTNETYCHEVLKLRDGDRLFSSSRLPFAYGLGNAFTFPLLNGCTSILCREKPTPEVIARVFEEYRPTIFFAVPVVYRMLLEHHRTEVRVPASVGQGIRTASGSDRTARSSLRIDPIATALGSDTKSPTKVGTLNTSSLRLCISAGEALPAQLGEDWQRTFGVEVLDGIGSTEMLHMFMSNHKGDVRYGSSGKLLSGYEAKLVDHEGAPVPEGTEGNLWIRGDSAASRYWQRPETSAQTFVDGWVRTGDLYRCDEQGCWWHMGRSDDCFKPTGQWVSPVEVEGVLVKCEGVRAAAVVEGFDKDGLSCVSAFIVGANENDTEDTVEQSLRALCESALPRFKQPRRYIFISELPYTATGKVQRFKLREQLRNERKETAVKIEK
jgi:acyl-coenzyme A synthetase/AMP-(fatty) acid ligase